MPEENKVKETKSEESKVEKRRFPKWAIALVVAVGILIVAGGVYGYYVYKKKSASKETQTASSTTTTTSSSDKIVDEGITWLKPPVKLEDLKLYEINQDMAGDTTYSYYKVGTTSAGGEIIVAEITPVMIGDPYIERLLKLNGKYYRIVRNSEDIPADSGVKTIGDVEDDNSTLYKSLKSDETLKYGATALTYITNKGITIPSNKELTTGKSTKMESTKWGDLYWYQEEPQSDIKNFTVGYYYILLNDSTWQLYNPKPSFLLDDGTFQVSWQKDSASSNKYKLLPASGCGGPGLLPVYASKSDISSDKVIATTSSGSKLYGAKDTSDPIATVGYESYKVGRQEGEATSIDEFVNNTGVVIWMDHFGTPVIYQKDNYMPQAECGKPVVYLYPVTPMDVSIKVGAFVTVSEPEYGDGWKGIAYPSGDVVVGGKTFGSLFWEGKGIGRYPQITSGRIVEVTRARDTIVGDLSYIGLNQKEIDDFVEFWMPKMPQMKYVRLTWLQNYEMDKLAPLVVSPKPDSVIRVFLDYQGLDQPTNIDRQELIQYDRTGFTAIEWGGLLKR